jgi:hypothetical protein
MAADAVQMTSSLATQCALYLKIPYVPKVPNVGHHQAFQATGPL